MASVTVALDSFVIADPEKSRSTCNVFVAHIDDADRERMGRLFVVSELSPSHPDNQSILHELQETISRAYYSITDRGVETAFEQALAEANSRLQDLLRGDQRPWLPGLATFVGVLKDSVFVFTHVGSIQAYLMRGNHIVDLVHANSPQLEVNPLKIFSSVVSGQLEEGDALLVASIGLLDYFSQEKIRRTVTSMTPTEAAAYFDRLLRDNPTNTAFAALILQLQRASASIPRRSEPSEGPQTVGGATSPGASMNRLIEKERATSELLTPSLWRSIRMLAGAGAHRLDDAVRTTVLHKPARRRVAFRRDRQERPRSLIVTALLGLGVLLWKLFRFLLILLVTGLTSLRRLFIRRPASSTPPAKDRLATAVRSIQRFNRRQQLILLGIVVLLLALAQGLIMAARPNSPKLTAPARAAIVQSINENVDRLNAMLSYGDEQGARKLIALADQQIASLPVKRKSDRQQVEALRAKLEGPKEKTRHVVRPTLEAQADLKTITLTPLELALLGKSLLVVGTTGQVADVTTAGKPALLPVKGTAIDVRDAIAEDRSILIRTTDSLLRFTVADKKVTQLTATLPAQPLAMAIFQSRLYIVDAGTDQIIRYPGSASGYGLGTPWIQDQTISVKDVVSVAVDGSIYLLSKDGSLTTLAQGAKSSFALDPIDPPLASATRMWTDAKSQSLYILSPASRRLVAFDKNGKLIAQYTGDAFGDALGFAIDEKGGKGYILTGTTVESFSLAVK